MSASGTTRPVTGHRGAHTRIAPPASAKCKE